jgi:Rps23 Pro-64 3,4-dihydroxylase Tpa1-like proline 4-hydroxylase
MTNFFDVFNEKTFSNAKKLNRNFLDAKPFKHVYILDFFNPEFAEQLHAHFPSNRGFIGESGTPERSSISFNHSKKDEVYSKLNDAVGDPRYIEFLQTVSSIDDLLFDHTHSEFEVKQSLSGEEMEPHIDCNYHFDLEHHRRLNLIAYLNKNWTSEMGGNIELHSNPLDWWKNEVVEYLAGFNVAVMFETGEATWHGFKKILIPETHQEKSRKSLAHYFYTKNRPSQEIAPRHGTWWVHRPLDYKKFKVGTELTKEMLYEIEVLLTRGYGRSNLYYKEASKLFEENYWLKVRLGLDIDSMNPIKKSNE